ncbi:MAG: AraC family transcriptional regulator [Anaerorhabdus sp.]
MGNMQYDIIHSTLSKVNCKLLYVSQANYAEDWHSIIHSHPFTELFYVQRGKGIFQVDNESFPVSEDDLVIVNSNSFHTESSCNEDPLEYIVVGFDGISLLSRENQHYSLHNYSDYKHEILFYIKTLYQEAKAKSDSYALISQNLLEVLLINIIRRTQVHLTVEAPKKSTRECAYVKQYIDKHFYEDISLEKLCELSFINKYYLVHSFKKYYNVSPIQYLQQRRLDEACNLLKNTDFSISEISQIVGMSSESYFIQVFKKNFKTTPRRYRSELQNITPKTITS